MEVQAEISKIRFPLPSRLPQAYLKKEKMEDLHTDLKEAINYLVQFFYKTGQVFSCSRTKIGKLLSIVAFLYARRGKKLFDQCICKYSQNCGTTITDLAFYVDRDIYIQYNGYDDGKKTIDSNLINNNITVPEQYINVDSISDDVKFSIKNVFLSFGAYSAIDLGNCINPIILYEGITQENGDIDLIKIYHLSKEDLLAQYNDNSIDKTLINYIFNSTTIPGESRDV